jgi:GNAT superfamily N-acetyltransferase
MRRVVAFAAFAAFAALGALAGAAPADPPPAATPAIDLERARALLPGFDDCADVPCLIDRAYRKDPEARVLALALWRDSGDLAGVGPDEIMDGGYRGKIHLVPELPIGAHRRHLAWVAEATRSIDRFFRDAFAGAAPRYRWRGLGFRFVRSVGKRTPSAYAASWAIEYNVAGSLLTSAAGVRDTLFHEVFHNNDEDHGDWSARQLRADYDAILARCGAAPTTACLAPYAPNTTMVRGGTYYAFQHNNGDSVHEYAAELALRYFKEQREMRAAGALAGRAFKCGPAENARAWRALVDEFFAGRDLVPAC